jgi:hypothetical protein
LHRGGGWRRAVAAFVSIKGAIDLERGFDRRRLTYCPQEGYGPAGLDFRMPCRRARPSPQARDGVRPGARASCRLCSASSRAVDVIPRRSASSCWRLELGCRPCSDPAGLEGQSIYPRPPRNRRELAPLQNADSRLSSGSGGPPGAAGVHSD